MMLGRDGMGSMRGKQIGCKKRHKGCFEVGYRRRMVQNQRGKMEVNALPAVDVIKCIGCGKCVRVCPTDNIVLYGQKAQIGSNCQHCGACLSVCPAGAIALV